MKFIIYFASQNKLISAYNISLLVEAWFDRNIYVFCYYATRKKTGCYRFFVWILSYNVPYNFT